MQIIFNEIRSSNLLILFFMFTFFALSGRRFRERKRLVFRFSIVMPQEQNQASIPRGY